MCSRITFSFSFLLLTTKIFANQIDADIESGKIFMDVIKNISRINDMLEDLIHNYKEAQRTHIKKNYNRDLVTQRKYDSKSNFSRVKLRDKEYVTTNVGRNYNIFNEFPSPRVPSIENFRFNSSDSNTGSDESSFESIDIEIEKFNPTQLSDSNQADGSLGTIEGSEETLNTGNKQTVKPGGISIKIYTKVQNNKSYEKVLNPKKSSSLYQDTMSNNIWRKSKSLKEQVVSACLKSSIKKCHRACVKARKSSCLIYKCSSNFKENFNKHSKQTCIDNYQISVKEDDDGKGKHDNVTTALTREELHKEVMTTTLTKKESYKDPCLLNIMRNNIRTLLKSKPELWKDHENQLNILRNRYERECKKENTRRCYDACEKALQLTCQGISCFKNLEKHVKKRCKTMCKSEFNEKMKSKHFKIYSRSMSNSDDTSRDSSLRSSDGDSSL